MKEEMYSELLEILIASKEEVSAGFEFAKGQSPILIDEIIKFKLIQHSLYAVSLLFIVLFLIKCGYYSFYKAKEDSCNGEWVVGCATIAVIIILPIIGLSDSISNIIKILVSPRLYLIEYLSFFVQ